MDWFQDRADVVVRRIFERNFYLAIYGPDYAESIEAVVEMNTAIISFTKKLQKRHAPEVAIAAFDDYIETFRDAATPILKSYYKNAKREWKRNPGLFAMGVIKDSPFPMWSSQQEELDMVSTPSYFQQRVATMIDALPRRQLARGYTSAIANTRMYITRPFLPVDQFTRRTESDDIVDDASEDRSVTYFQNWMAVAPFFAMAIGVGAAEDEMEAKMIADSEKPAAANTTPREPTTGTYVRNTPYDPTGLHVTDEDEKNPSAPANYLLSLLIVSTYGSPLVITSEFVTPNHADNGVLLHCLDCDEWVYADPLGSLGVRDDGHEIMFSNGPPGPLDIEAKKYIDELSAVVASHRGGRTKAARS